MGKQFPTISQQAVERASFAGRADIGPLPKNTTYRTERVSQQEGTNIVAAKKQGLLGLAASRMPQSSRRAPAPDTTRAMAEQNKQTMAAAAKLTNRTPYGS